MTDVMFSIVLLGGIILFLAVIALIDWLGRRKDQQSEHRPAV